MTRIWAAGTALAALAIVTVFLRGPWEVVAHAIWVALMVWSAALAFNRRSSAYAARSAALLAVVARAGKSMNRLGTEEVLEGVIAAVGEMGFESANISIIDEERGTYRVIHARGMPADYAGAEHPATIGMTGLARAARATVAVADYGSQAAAVPRLAQAGFKSAVAGPIWVGGELEGVLVGGSKRHRKLRAEEIEAFELLATHAGVALENARRYEELERSRAQIRHQAQHDALTGLANRGLFRDELATALTRATGAVLYIDLDGFKAVNDELGHAAGDLLLTIVGERLRRSLRPGDLAARLGGDEFGVLLRAASPVEAAATARRLRAALSEPFALDGRTVAAGASIGVAAIALSSAVDVDQLLGEADAAMYEDKRAHGRRRSATRPGA
jgi:diguanylate cyclase (GGDEF)-like protein